MASQITTSSRCLGLVSTPFIAPGGGRPNITAKVFATLWYLLVLPDAQSRLHRQIRRKRVPWYAASRLIGIVTATANIITMPLSWAFLFAGKRNASRLATFSVLLNPPSITLSLLLISELSTALINKSTALVSASASLISKPFCKKDDSESTPTSKTD